MSKYTTEVRFICETYAGLSESVGLTKVKDVLAQSWNKVFDFDFPIFDEKYRSVLCQKILRHYYTREISGETVALWKLWLENRMNEIMPYYNKLYETEKLKYDPLTDVAITTTHTGSGTDTGTVGQTGSGNRETHGTANGTNGTEATQAYSDTPQGSLTGVKNMTYLTSAQHNTNESNTNNTYQDTETNSNTSKQTRDLSSTDEYVHTVKGKSAGVSYMKLISEYRKNLLNIDMQIIEELSDLFFNLW